MCGAIRLDLLALHTSGTWIFIIFMPIQLKPRSMTGHSLFCNFLWEACFSFSVFLSVCLSLSLSVSLSLSYPHTRAHTRSCHNHLHHWIDWHRAIWFDRGSGGVVVVAYESGASGEKLLQRTLWVSVSKGTRKILWHYGSEQTKIGVRSCHSLICFLYIMNFVHALCCAN